MNGIVKYLPRFLKSALRRFAYKRTITASQAGQDYWVYGEAFNQKRDGYFLDIGAHDGIWLSNTYLLELKFGWSGICVEGNPNTFKSLEKNRKNLSLNTCLDESPGSVDFVLRGVKGGIVGKDVDNRNSFGDGGEIVEMKTERLETVLDRHEAPHIIDYLSIDVEGAEERILGKFNFEKYTFRCITIERPSQLLRDKFDNHGYILIKEIPDLDCFYVHRSFLDEYKRNYSDFYKKKHLCFRWK